MNSLPLALIAAVIMGALLTCAARRLAWRIGMLDHPDQGRKNHRQPTPLLGGVAVLGSLLATVAAAQGAAAAGWIELELSAAYRGMFLSAIAFCAVGLVDDRLGMRARTKLLFQIAAALPFVIDGRIMSEFGILGIVVELGWWGVPATIFWITLCVNSVNLLDGHDAVAGTVGVVVSGTVCLLAVAAGQVGTALIAVALCGSIIGFLVFNWPPAKIFLGDSGSLPIGFLLGALALEGSLKTATGLTLAAPLLLMSIPGFDTTMAVLRRVLNGRGIGQGDRAHLHHCLKDRGLSPVQTVLAIGCMCLAMGSAVIASVYFRNDWIAVGGCAALLVVLIAGRVFGFEETRLLWRHLRHLTASSARASRVIRLQTLREALLATSSPAPFDAWGQLCKFVEEQGGLSLELFVEESPLGNTRTLMAWHAGERHRLDRHELWEFCYRPPREGEHALGIAVASKVNAALAQLAAEHLCQLMSAFCRRQAAEVATATADRDRLVRISQEAA